MVPGGGGDVGVAVDSTTVIAIVVRVDAVVAPLVVCKRRMRREYTNK